MKKGSKTEKSPFGIAPLEYLTQKQMEDIHQASLQILEEVGTEIHHEETIQILELKGARLTEENRLHIPAKLVDEAIQSAPSAITIYDRNSSPAMELGGRNFYFGTGSDCPNLLDSFSGERRPFLYKDVEDSVRLVDALPNINFTMSNGLAADIDPKIQYQKKYALMVRNTVKPQVITAENRQCLQDIVDIASCVLGNEDKLIEKPLFVLYNEPTSPLIHTEEALEKLLFMAEKKLPINYSPGMMAGASCPVTISGAIAQANAEILTGLVIHQLKNPGAPFVFGAGMSPLDMKSCQPTYSAPEAMVAQAGLCQIGRTLHKLPTWGFGGCSASKLDDEQAVNEASSYLFMSAWMGTNLIHDVGYTECGLTYSFNLLVMCDEIIGQIRRMAQGIRVDSEYLAVDAIKRVGPGGHFLDDQHTVNHFRENWNPQITDRMTYEQWKNQGASSFCERAKRTVKETLENHKPEPLPSETNQRIDEILERLE